MKEFEKKIVDGIKAVGGKPTVVDIGRSPSSHQVIYGPTRTGMSGIAILPQVAAAVAIKSRKR